MNPGLPGNIIVHNRTRRANSADAAGLPEYSLRARRQQPFAPARVDFDCRPARLADELERTGLLVIEHGAEFLDKRRTG